MPNNDQHQRDLKLARFRGWSLTALYFALALWAIIFIYIGYEFWNYFHRSSGEVSLMPFVLMISSILTFLVSARAGHNFLQAMRTKAVPPAVDLLPFLAISVTIVVAVQEFGLA